MIFLTEPPLPLPTWVSPEALSGLGTLGLVAGMMLFFYWLAASGRILTKSQVQRLLDAQDKYNAKQDETITHQRDTIDSLVTANNILRLQNSDLIEANKIATDFFRKVPVTGQLKLTSTEDTS